MKIWILASRPINDTDGELDNNGFIEWYENNSTKNISVGDIVYSYISSPTMEIHHKCVVTDTGFYFDQKNRRVYTSSVRNKYDNQRFFELKPIRKFTLTHLLTFEKLKSNGLKSRLMGPQTIYSPLTDYLDYVEKLEISDEIITKEISTLSEKELEKLATKYGTTCPTVKKVTTHQYSRNQYVAQYAKKRARGYCQLCNVKAPFDDENGNPYLESHHIIWLSKGGDDTVNNTVALCPNCHRKMHIINDKNDVNYLLQKNLLSTNNKN